jgi:quercetin dioxygenase-like cupin family protein
VNGGPKQGFARNEFAASFTSTTRLARFVIGPVEVWPLGGELVHDGPGTMYMATVSRAELSYAGEVFPVPGAGYAVVPGAAVVRGGSGLSVVHRAHRGLFSVGGPVEATGRLRYIDGCRDTVLVAPVVRGDPCLNLLHLPPRTVQSDHHHPSLRVGLIVSGRGICVLGDGRSTVLNPGVVFFLPAGTIHRFETAEDDLLLMAWHPDSEVGPTDDDHPMLNRTLQPDSAERVR